MYVLTGGSGVLGTEFQRIAPKFGIDILPLTREDVFDISVDADICAHLNDNPDYGAGAEGIIHCAAFTDVPKAEQWDYRQEAIDDNIIGTQNIAHTLCYHLDCKLIYISTDYVYPGRQGNYKETDRTQPVNFYALTKLAGEAYARPWMDLVVRTSFKPNVPWPYARAFDDLYTSADYVDIIAPKILTLICNRARGIYNVGTERKSIYDLAKRRTAEVEPISKKEIKDVYLPSDISMNLDKFNEFCSKLR